MIKSKLIIVLGMHRSGTSVITRALQVFDITLGDSLLSNLPENPKGFWEDLDVVALNEEILSFLGQRWFDLIPIRDDELKSLRHHGYHLQALELLRRKVAAHEFFGLKDPRISKLLPFWQQVFANSDYEIHYILAIRNPLSVAKSLAHRDGFNAVKSYLAWLGHIIPVLDEIINERVLVVNYDRLIDTPTQELERIANTLELAINPIALLDYTDTFLDKNLRHTQYKTSDLALDIVCPVLVFEVYGLLEVLAAKSEVFKSTDTEQKILAWQNEFMRLVPILIYLDQNTKLEQENQRIMTESQLKLVNLGKLTLEEQVHRDGLIEQIQAKNLALNTLTEQLSDCNQRIEDLQGALVQAELACQYTIVETKQTISTLTEQLNEKNQKIQDLFASYSWRLMLPFRVGSRPFRRVAARFYAALNKL